MRFASLMKMRAAGGERCRGSGSALPFIVGAAVAAAGEAFAQRRHADDAGDRRALVQHAEKHAEKRHAADEGPRPVDRVDDPGIFGVRLVALPNSSPRIPWSGKRARIARRMYCSVSRSAIVTGDIVRLVLDGQRGAEIAHRDRGGLAADIDRGAQQVLRERRFHHDRPPDAGIFSRRSTKTWPMKEMASSPVLVAAGHPERDQAPARPRAARLLGDHFVHEADRVAGIDRLQPFQLVEAGGGADLRDRLRRRPRARSAAAASGGH